MLNNQPPANFYQNLQHVGIRYSGLYLLNKFFIKVSSNKLKSDIPSYDYENHAFSDEDQLKLQEENYPSLYHEYIHYVHEVSTIAGITQFYHSVVQRDIFKDFVKLPETSLPESIKGKQKEVFDKLNQSMNGIMGGSLNDLEGRLVYEINLIESYDFPAYEPTRDTIFTIKVPMIVYSYVDKQSSEIRQDSVYFGKYFLYEGLAHHLDQLVTKQLGRPVTPISNVLPEYRMMELVSKYLFPAIDERSMLEMASMSLCYFNCGQRFIRMIEEAATAPHLQGYLMELRNEVHDHLTCSREEIHLTLKHIKKLFENRSAMHAAVTHLCDVMAAAYDKRIKSPVFEIDLTYSGHTKEMRQFVDLCDMVYELADSEEYLRDFAGTYQDNVLANDLKTFLCHVDYYQTSIAPAKEHCCPLFTFCPHRLRQEKPSQCSINPRLAFEDRENFGWCHYSLGVGYTTGNDQENPLQDS